MDKCIGTKEVGSPKLWRAAIAECVGTLFLTMIGCGTCLGADNWEDASTPTTVQIALAFGLAVATMVWCIGHVSGGHINPAVTMAMLVTRRISLISAAIYILFQMLGATIGAGFLAGFTSRTTWGYLGRTSVDSNITTAQGFSVEFFITFVLVLTVFASCDNKRNDIGGSVPLTIGFSVAVCHLFAIKYTGSSMNPARSFGPAVILSVTNPHPTMNATSGELTEKFIDGFENQWLYWLAPILGGVVAGLLYEIVFAANASLERTRAMFSKCPYDRDASSSNNAEGDGVAMEKV